MKFLRVLSFLFLIIALLVAGAFAFIEIRSFVAHDYTLMQNPLFSGAGYISRAIFYVAMFLCIITLMVKKIFKRRTSIFILVLSIALVAGSIATFFFYMLPIAIAIISISLILFIISLVRLLIV